MIQRPGFQSIALSLLCLASLASAQIQAQTQTQSQEQARPPAQKQVPPQESNEFSAILARWSALHDLDENDDLGAVLDPVRQRQVDDLIGSLSTTLDAMSASSLDRLDELADARLAADLVSPVASEDVGPLPAGTLGRVLRHTQDGLFVIDIATGEDEQLDALYAQRVEFTIMGINTLMGLLGDAAPDDLPTGGSYADGGGTGGGTGGGGEPHICFVWTQNMPAQDPPDCITAYGITYQISPGLCPDIGCWGHYRLTASFADCTDFKIIELIQSSDGTLTTIDPAIVFGTFDVPCGTQVLWAFSEGGYPAGGVKIVCSACDQ